MNISQKGRSILIRNKLKQEMKGSNYLPVGTHQSGNEHSKQIYLKRKGEEINKYNGM